MIPLQIADLLMSGVSQGTRMPTGASGGTIDFLSLFQRAVEVDAAAPTTDGAVATGIIDVRGISASPERLVMPRSSSDGTVAKDPAAPVIDPAAAMLMATFNLSAQSALPEPLAGPALTSGRSPQVMADGSVVATFSAARALSDRVPAIDLIAEATAYPAADPRVMSPEAVAAAVIPEPAPPPRQGSDVTLPSDVETRVAATDRAMGMLPRVDTLSLSDSPIPVTGGDATISSVVRDAQASSAAPPADPTAAGSVRLGLPLQPDRAVVTTAALQPATRHGEAAADSQADIVKDNAALSVIPEPVGRWSEVVATPVTATTEPSGTVQQPPIGSRGSSGTRQSTADAETLVASVNSARSGANIGGEDPSVIVGAAGDEPERGHVSSPVSARAGESSSTPFVSLRPPRSVGEGEIRREEPRMTRLPSLPVSAVQEVRNGISYSSRGEATGQAGDPPALSAAVAVEDPTRVAAVLSEGAADRPAVRGVSASEQSDAPESEAFGGEEFPDRLRTIRADGDRTAGRQAPPRLEAAQNARQDRPASGSEREDLSYERSSSHSSDGRPFDADLAYVAAPKGEPLRSGADAPPAYPRTIVDQVADQIATTARMSPRAEGERVRLRLHPETLGELVIEVSWKDSGIVAAIKTQSRVAGELLTNDLSRLRTALGEQGIPISGLGVQVGLDLRQWSYAGTGTHTLPFVRQAPEAQAGRDRESASPSARAMEPERLIDIRV
ncbi:MAG: hypothetical protein C3F08_00230 [Candidatus Methylomirabilota bacterium]|nr:MAG: hypothetical protein C3F08_00230 [candidate division NC10 bacterium]